MQRKRVRRLGEGAGQGLMERKGGTEERGIERGKKSVEGGRKEERCSAHAWEELPPRGCAHRSPHLNETLPTRRALPAPKSVPEERLPPPRRGPERASFKMTPPSAHTSPPAAPRARIPPEKHTLKPHPLPPRSAPKENVRCHHREDD